MQCTFNENSTESVGSGSITSIQDQLGWTQLEDIIIPYLLRCDVKYVPLWIVDLKFFQAYRQIFTDKIQEYVQLFQVKATAAELVLLNNINFQYWNCNYGRFVFTDKDVIVSLNDIKELIEFLKFCQVALLKKTICEERRCGFIKIDDVHCVPYVYIESKQYVPLFYFSGSCSYQKEKYIPLKGWDLAYLKIACRLHGIKKYFYHKVTVIDVIESEFLKIFLEPYACFEEVWPVNGIIHRQTKYLFVKTKKTEAPPITNWNEFYPQWVACNTNYSMNSVPPSLQSGNYELSPFLSSLKSLPDQSLSNNNKRVEIDQDVIGISHYQIRETVDCRKDGSYTLQMFQIENIHMNFCINLKPFTNTVLLVTLQELTYALKVSVEEFTSAATVIGLNVYLPNKHQRAVYQLAGVSITAGLLRIDYLLKNLQRIKSILNSQKN